MSIIQEALKKAEIKVETPTLRESPPPTPRKVEEIVFTRKAVTRITSRKPAFDKRMILLPVVAMLLVSVFYFATRLIISIKNNPNKTTATVTQDVSYRTIRPIGAETLMANPKETPFQGKALTVADHPRLELNGIMYRKEGARAIVNNAIVEEGDSISGAKVMKINERNVVLIYNDVEITINLK